MCGTTRLEDAEAAVSAGMDALGFIFFDKSPRFVSRDLAASIIRELPPFITRVGVFVNSSMDHVKEHVKSCGLTQVQLHGDESPAYCETVKTWNPGCSVCKAFRIGRDSVPADLDTYSPVVDSFLFDTYIKGREGGTGQSFDWSLIDALKPGKPLILAGGLNPENVAEAVASIAPYGLDVNSGVESAPGVKDRELINLLVTRVRAADQLRLPTAP
jgi:phosphoribosylanthranilate isomerase